MRFSSLFHTFFRNFPHFFTLFQNFSGAERDLDGAKSEKTKGQQLKGKIVSALFHTFFTLFSHFFFRTFPEFFLQDFS